MKTKWVVVSIGFLFIPCSKLTVGVALGAEPFTIFDTQSQTTLSLAFNPVKPFIGLINLEIECRFTNRMAVHLFMEYLVKEVDHPDIVISFGPRLYNNDGANTSDFFWGVNLGYLWFRNDSAVSSFTAGGEAGYRGLITDRLYLLPRAFITCPLRSPKLLPGAEMLTGMVL